ncbi:MAG: hypothetical protein U0Q15_13695 [Kineosporiaceae bacterium]
MVWAMVWTGMVLAGLLLHALLARAVWRQARGALREVSEASRRFGTTAEAVRESFESRYPRAQTPQPAPFADPRSLRRAHEPRLRIARTRAARRTRAAIAAGQGARGTRPPRPAPPATSTGR